MSSGVQGCAEQQDILAEGAVEETHGAHPPASVHKNPLEVLIWQDVTRISGEDTHSATPPLVCSHPFN